MGAGNMKRCLILLLACLLLTGCAARSGTAAEQELNVALSMYPVTMDAQLATDAGSAQYIDLICGRLLRLDPEKGCVPELAESFEISEDGCTYTFRLREGIRYSNGEPIDAGDFVDAFRRIADPLTASAAIYVLQDLCRMKNVDEVSGQAGRVCAGRAHPCHRAGTALPLSPLCAHDGELHAV